MTLRSDGSVDVTESIEVNAEGGEIRRGIYRDIPTTLINADKSRLRSSLEVVSVLRDGRPEPYKLETLGGGFQRIRIGNAEALLSLGAHRYTIRYSMTRMGRTFDDHDELFWNATGNYWNFPILSAVASITLPQGAVIDRVVGYTGALGSEEQAVRIERTGDNSVLVRTARVLQPLEGLSVALSFQKGVLAAPDGSRRLVWWLSDHRDLVLPLIAVGLVLLYNLLAWSAVGRDPAKGVIIPLFHAPKGYSPALVHYIHRMGWQKNGWTAFTAAIFDLGAKGLLRIDNPGKTLKVTVTGKQPEEKLPAGEALLFDYFTAAGRVTVDSKSGPKLNLTRGEFIGTLERENREVYFRNNMLYVVGGLLFSALCLGGLVWAQVLDPTFLAIAVVGGIAIGLFTSVLSSVWSGKGIGRFLLIGWVAIVGANLLGSLGASLTLLRIDPPLIGALSIVVINVVFGVLMRAPTVQGRRLMDQIDGFKMYLETAEKNRLNMQGEPPMSVERFERILPYAIALGVEKPWSEHFEGELSRNAVAGAGSQYQPSFYAGRDWSGGGGFSSNVAAVATGMSAAMIAAQPASASSSGFSGGGGGGGSGGGGGGGGGGGW